MFDDADEQLFNSFAAEGNYSMDLCINTINTEVHAIGAHGTVPETSIVAHVPWLPLATIGAVFTQYAIYAI